MSGREERGEAKGKKQKARSYILRGKKGGTEKKCWGASVVQKKKLLGKKNKRVGRGKNGKLLKNFFAKQGGASVFVEIIGADLSGERSPVH